MTSLFIITLLLLIWMIISAGMYISPPRKYNALIIILGAPMLVLAFIMYKLGLN